MHRILSNLLYTLKPKTTGIRHQSSGLNSDAYTCAEGIDAYIKRCTAIITTARSRLGTDAAASIIEGNSPYYIRSETSAGEKKPVLLMVHGLTDSPYSTHDLADFFKEQGFSVLSILLPGHGTCPGDLLEVDWRDWVNAHTDAVNALAEQGDSIYLCGFSMGATLNLYHALNDSRIKGLFLFSPALRLPSIARLACVLHWLSRWMPSFKWVDVQPDDDPFKYESGSANAICQTYYLVKHLKHLISLRSLKIPVFIAASEDDATVDSKATVEFFEKLESQHKRLLYFRRSQSNLPGGARAIHSELPEKNIVSSSHMAMVIAPENRHYGEKGDYAFCTHYYRTDHDKYLRCKASQDNYLGEINCEPGSQDVVRRLTYNPWFSELLSELNKFIIKIR